MVKCPNCGSSAQITLIGTDYVTYAHLIEIWRCGCGCIVRRTMKTMNEFIEYPDGRVEKKGG